MSRRIPHILAALVLFAGALVTFAQPAAAAPGCWRTYSASTTNGARADAASYGCAVDRSRCVAQHGSITEDTGWLRNSCYARAFDYVGAPASVWAAAG